jgi:UDP-glucose 4-epimerase
MLEISGLDPDKNLRFVRQEEIYGNKYEDIPRRIPDITKLKTVLGVTPSTSLADGLRATIDWFRQEQGTRPALTSASLESPRK